MGSTPIIGTSEIAIFIGKSDQIRFCRLRTVAHENARKDRLLGKYSPSNFVLGGRVVGRFQTNGDTFAETPHFIVNEPSIEGICSCVEEKR
jgi:hypothetical protein